MMETLKKLIENLQKDLASMFTWQLVVINVIILIIIFLIIRFLLWNRVTKFLDEKQDVVNRELFDTHNENKRIQQLKSETLREYEAVKDESKKLKDMLSQEAHAERDRIVAEARLEAKRRLDQVEFDVQQQMKDSEEKIKESIKVIAFAAAEKIVQRELDEEVHDALIEQVIKDELG